ncbi:6779_t:CDS:2, partial [Scutellospora calospora]
MENYPLLFMPPCVIASAGKSTLGNLLLDQPHDDGPFVVSDSMVRGHIIFYISIYSEAKDIPNRIP